jgi:hypothetical protein
VSVVIIRSLFCDGKLAEGPCPQWYGQIDGPATLLRKMAAREGWRARRGKDYCPDCPLPTRPERAR